MARGIHAARPPRDGRQKFQLIISDLVARNCNREKLPDHEMVPLDDRRTGQLHTGEPTIKARSEIFANIISYKAMLEPNVSLRLRVIVFCRTEKTAIFTGLACIHRGTHNKKTSNNSPTFDRTEEESLVGRTADERSSSSQVEGASTPEPLPPLFKKARNAPT